MKQFFSSIAFILIAAATLAQAPENMSYQAVVRDATSALVTNQNVSLRISILQGSPGGTSEYTETHSTTTNINGLVSLEIGSGTVVSGNFSTIDWSAGPYFLHTETDPTGGTNYTISGTSELLSVPYALYAATADSIVGGFTEVDGSTTNELQTLSISNDTIYLTNGGFVVVPGGFDGQYSSLTGAPTNVSSFSNDAGYLTNEVDGSITNELQTLSMSNDTIYLTNGGFVVVTGGFDGQYSSLSGAPTNVSSFSNDAGYLTSEVDGSTTNELQTLSISNDTIYLTNGGFVVVPGGFDGQYSNLTGAPTNVSSFSNDAGYLTTEVDGSTTNELQTISRTGTTVTLSNGGGSYTDSVNTYSAGSGIDITNNVISTTGGGPAGTPEYLHINPTEMNGGKLGWTSADVMASNNIVVNETTEEITLKAGKIYVLEASIYLHTTNALQGYTFRFYDATNSTYLGNASYVRTTDYSAASIINQPVATAIVAPTSDIQVYLSDINGVTGSFLASGFPERNYIRVTELR